MQLRGWDFMGNFDGIGDNSYAPDYGVATDEFGNPYDSPSPTYTAPVQPTADDYGAAYDSMTPAEVQQTIQTQYGYTAPASAAPFDWSKLLSLVVPAGIPAGGASLPTPGTPAQQAQALASSARTKQVLMFAALGIGAFVLFRAVKH